MTLVDRKLIRLLIVDDEEDFRDASCSYFRKFGYQVESAENGRAALELTEKSAFDVAVIDIHMPEMDGLELLEQLQEGDNETQAIMLTGGGTIENAVESMKRGAFDFLTKPAKLNELDLLIQRAYLNQQLKKENRSLKRVLDQIQKPSRMIGQSDAMNEVYRLIEKTAISEKPVLIEGESGTGKELVARAIHEKSNRSDKPLVVINCAALPEALMESELFGHEKGAFTGAASAKPGLFETAHNGTLFIDEFGELAGSLQAKLLRVLEDGSLRRVGSVKERKVNVRLIVATNRRLADEVKLGNFREDLFYRVNVLGITLPPLRERAGDVQLLIDHFAGEDWKIEEQASRILNGYSWPGNIRQLENAIERAKILADSNEIVVENLPNEIVESGIETPVIHDAEELESINRAHVSQVYEKNDRNKTRTAKALGIGRRSLYRLLEKYGIE